MHQTIIKRAARWAMIAALAAGSTIGLSMPALAQGFGVPQELLDTTRPVQGDSIRICIDNLSIGAPFDQEVSEAIANALLLTPQIGVAPGGFPLDGLGYFDELQIAMTNSCDMLPGISIQPNAAFPAWATVTRPYAQVPFVFVVKDPAYQKLDDIPFDKRIGTALGSLGESQLLVYMTQRPESQQWLRLPYADPALMLKRVLDGSIAGMFIWQPALMKVTNGDPAAQGLRIIPTDPMPEVNVAVGALVSARDAFLRSQIDDAIGSLVADGTIAAIMTRHGYAGTPGP